MWQNRYILLNNRAVTKRRLLSLGKRDYSPSLSLCIALKESPHETRPTTPKYLISILAKLGALEYTPILIYILIFSPGFQRVSSKQCGVKNLPAKTMSALQLPTLLCGTTESLLVTGKMLWPCVSKLSANLLALCLPPRSQAAHRLRLCLPESSVCLHTHTEGRLTWAVLFQGALCTLSCAVSFWCFSGTLLHFLFPFPLLHSCLYSTTEHLLPLQSLRNIWSDSCLMANNPEDWKNLFLTCHVNTSAPFPSSWYSRIPLNPFLVWCCIF